VWIAEVLFPGQKALRILDYGGGDGKLTELLRVAGFTSTRVRR
jgi:hypothetical protein